MSTPTLTATSDSDRSPAPARRSPTRLADALGVLWVLAAAFAVMLPALVHGASLGPFDDLSVYGLTQRHGVVIHNGVLYDQVAVFNPWTYLAWNQVHHGLLPLWNPYSVLGMPLAFNWQSSVFSLPALVGYLFPLHVAYTVQILVTLVVAGTGAYVFGRVLGLGVLGCVLAATVYELSGPFIAWLGWPNDQVMSWAGWLFAAAVVVVRGRHRVGAVLSVALITAAAVYAGQPEILIMLELSLVLFVAVLLLRRLGRLGGSGPILRPALDLVVGTVTGAALAAPLLLPGLQVVGATVRSNPGSSFTTAANLYRRALTLHDLAGVVFSNYDGSQVAGSHFFNAINAQNLAAYLGLIPVVLAVLAVVVRGRRPEAPALAVVGLAFGAAVFVPPVVSVLDALPRLGAIVWLRALLPMAFAVSILAGMGLDTVVRRHADPAVRRWLVGLLGAGAVLVAALWLGDRGGLLPVDLAERDKSFVWPVVSLAVGAGAWFALVAAHAGGPGGAGRGGPRPARAALGAGLALVACQTAFLVVAGAPIPSSSPSYFAPTPAVVTLEHTVGSSLVGLGKDACPFVPPAVGINGDVNIVYGVHEFDVYDPTIPGSYFASWRAATGTTAGRGRHGSPNFFCPDVTSATEARLYGIAYVLEPPFGPVPTGTVRVRQVGDETLYRVPGAARATLVRLGPGGTLPRAEARGTPVAVTHPGPSSWSLTTDATAPAELRLRLSDVAGWHAAIDGRPLALRPFAAVMLQARVPPGHHRITLTYWPTSLTAGFVLAGVTTCGVVGTAVLARRRRRAGERGALRSGSAPATPPDGPTTGAALPAR
ncbi:MAG TPA: YfhO family protein [Acidimicrobiales bacterium]|nr:YfhO family protein [Acidimicrobiales bacterium]